jgi:hypothetical protein
MTEVDATVPPVVIVTVAVWGALDVPTGEVSAWAVIAEVVNRDADETARAATAKLPDLRNH